MPDGGDQEASIRGNVGTRQTADLRIEALPPEVGANAPGILPEDPVEATRLPPTRHSPYLHPDGWSDAGSVSPGRHDYPRSIPPREN